MSLELISEDERMAIRLIAFDMDDTLLRDDRTRLLLIHFSFRITLPVSAT